mgnify:CR=1 FL=1
MNTSTVTSMEKLFENKNDFNDDIGEWNVSNVTDMSDMFSIEFKSTGSFNGDISG